MGYSIRHNNVWLSSSDMRIYHSNAWQPVKEAWIYSGGSWKQFLSQVPNLTKKILLLTKYNSYLMEPKNIKFNAASINISGDGSDIKNWNPSANAPIYTLSISGSNVYLGGEFTSINGDDRNYAACVDIIFGTATAWNPNCNNFVNAIATSGSNIYLGGQFTSVGSNNRNYTACVDANDGGTLLSWDPNLQSYCKCIVLDEFNVYIGGEFSYVNGYNYFRRGIIKVDPIFGAIRNWDVNSNGYVDCIAISGTNLYLGGGFTTIGGVSRLHVARIDKNTALVDEFWAPNCNEKVLNISISDSIIYLAGQFTYVNNLMVSRNYIAAVDSVYGNATIWNPNCDGVVEYINISDFKIYICGQFNTVAGATRPKIACINIDGTITAWQPSSTGPIHMSCISNFNAYIVGNFKGIGAIPNVSNDAIFLNNSDNINTFNTKEINRNYTSIFAYDNKTIYYDYYDIYHIRRLKSINIDTDIINDFHNSNVSFDDTITALCISGSDIYMGGNFLFVGYMPRKNLAKFNITQAQVDNNWRPEIHQNEIPIVKKLQSYNNKLYIGGKFKKLNLLSKFNIASVDSISGNLIDIPLQLDDMVSDMVIINDTLIVGGNFNHKFDKKNNCLINFNADNPNSQISDASLQLGVSYNIETAYVSGDKSYISGRFDDTFRDSGNNYYGVKRYNGIDGSFDNFNIKNANIFTMAFSGSNIYLGGGFESITSNNVTVAAGNLKAVDVNGNFLNWNSYTNNWVYSIKLYNDKIYICGGFTAVNGISEYSGLACLNSNGDAHNWKPVQYFSEYTKYIEIVNNYLYGVNNVGNVYKYDITTAEPSAEPIIDLLNCGSINSMMYDHLNGFIYVVGQFEYVDSNSEIGCNIAVFTSVGCFVPPTINTAYLLNIYGQPSIVYDITNNTTNGNPIICGEFTNTIAGPTNGYCMDVNTELDYVGMPIDLPTNLYGFKKFAKPATLADCGSNFNSAKHNLIYIRNNDATHYINKISSKNIISMNLNSNVVTINSSDISGIIYSLCTSPSADVIYGTTDSNVFSINVKGLSASNYIFDVSGPNSTVSNITGNLFLINNNMSLYEIYKLDWDGNIQMKSNVYIDITQGYTTVPILNLIV